MKRVLTILILTIFLSLNWACQQGGGSAAPIDPMSTNDFEYFMSDYRGEAVKEGFELKEVMNKPISERYMMKEARYNFKASEIYRSGDSSPIGLLIAFDVEREFSSLAGKEKKVKSHYFCIPSSKTQEGNWAKYLKEIQNLGVKDYEVYIMQLSKLFSNLKYK